MNTPQRSYRYYDFVMAAFVCVLLCANRIGVVPFSSGILFFPISYIFGDILTKVYGGRDQRVVWAGFAALVWQLRQQLRDGENENLERVPLVMDAHRRLNTDRRSSRFRPVLRHCLYGIWPNAQIITTVIAQHVLKTCWEVLMTPVTYRAAAFLKRTKNEGWYDRNTNLNPFHVRV